MSDDNRRATDDLVREMYSDIKVLKNLSESNHNWLREHETKLDQHSDHISSFKTTLKIAHWIIGLAWTAMLATVGWLIGWHRQ